MRPFDVLELEIFGESHSPEIGARLAGLPAGESFDPEEVARFAARRKSGKYLFSTPRREEDECVFGGCAENADGTLSTTDAPLTARILNTNIRPADYGYLRTPRPSHADYCSYVKDGERAARSGGGRFSGRMTAPLVAMGGVAKQLLEKRGIRVAAYIAELAGVKGRSYRDKEVSFEEAQGCLSLPLPMLLRWEEAAEKARLAAVKGDSVGGVTECIAYGLPAGLGDALFGGLESKLSAVIYAIPAVKGVEFGAGFAIAAMRGSEANDPFIIREGKVLTAKNDSGGLNGGITNGMPVTMRVAFRPTPSISLPQRTVDLASMTETEIVVKGRHDATVVPRAVAAVEAAVAIALLDAVLYGEREQRS